MKNIKFKRITLFLLESIIIQDNRPLSEEFIFEFNNFLCMNYRNNKELFSYLFATELLKDSMEDSYEMLSLEQVINLMEIYHGFDGYLYLLDEVGLEVDSKLNELAILFANYCNGLDDLYDKTYSYGYFKISH